MVPFFLLFILIEGKWRTEFVNMERVAHIFLHKVGSGKLVCSVCWRLYLLILWNMSFAVTAGSVFLYVEETLSEREWHFFHLTNSRCCLSVFCYHTLQLTSHLYTVYLPPVCKLPRLSPGLVNTVTWLYTPYDKLFILHCALSCVPNLMRDIVYWTTCSFLCFIHFTHTIQLFCWVAIF